MFLSLDERCESSQGRLVLRLGEGIVCLGKGVRLGMGMYT